MRKLIIFLSLIAPVTARAQCALPITSGEVWTYTQWNNCFNYLLTSTGPGGLSGTNFGSSFPTSGFAVGVANGGNFVSLSADSFSDLYVNLKTPLPTGTNVIGAVMQSGLWSMSLIGAIPLPTGASVAQYQGGTYNNTAPTLVNGQQTGLQVDINGNLKVNVVTGGGSGGGTSSTYGSSFPVTGTAIGAKNSGNMIAVGADSSGNLLVNLATALPTGANAIGSVAQSGPWNVTNITGTVSLPTGAATAANQTAVVGTVSPGTAAANSMLGGGVYNSTQPTPTTGQQVALQVDSHGNVRIAPGARTMVPLDVATVTTGGTAVTALSAGHRTAGGWLYNPATATINLCINEIGTATGTTSAGSTTCIPPGTPYTLAASTGAVSVISSDSSHAFSGEGLQ